MDFNDYYHFGTALTIISASDMSHMKICQVCKIGSRKDKLDSVYSSLLNQNEFLYE